MSRPCLLGDLYVSTGFKRGCGHAITRCRSGVQRRSTGVLRDALTEWYGTTLRKFMWGFLPFGVCFGSLYMGKWITTTTRRRSTICDQ